MMSHLRLKPENSHHQNFKRFGWQKFIANVKNAAFLTLNDTLTLNTPPTLTSLLSL